MLGPVGGVPEMRSALTQFEAMWTTDLWKYRALRSLGGTLIFDVELGAPLSMSVESDVHDAIVRRMEEAGLEPITAEEAARIGMRRHLELQARLGR